MKNKIKEWCINIGGVIATLLMFAPLYIIVNSEKYSTQNCLFYLVVWIFYDIYMYQIIQHRDDKKKAKEHYYKWVKDADKKLSLELSYEEKFKNLEKYIEDYFNN